MVDLYSGQELTTKTDIWSMGVLLYKLCFFSLPFGESALAIQGGQFSVPDDSKYSPEVHALIKYMLHVDAESRPDIFCVSRTAFEIAGLECPVKNLHRSTPPEVKSLPVPPTESEWRHARTRVNAGNNGAGSPFVCGGGGPMSGSGIPLSTNFAFPESTSVVPRERPKVAKTTTQSILMKVAERSPMSSQRNVSVPPVGIPDLC